MILADTSIVVEYLRTPAERVLMLLSENDAAICGVIRTEVLAGARDRAHLQRIAAALDAFAYLATSEATWDSLGENLRALRAAGLTVPLPDALIATVAIEDGVEVWTRDAHFARMHRRNAHEARETDDDSGTNCNGQPARARPGRVGGGEARSSVETG